MNRAVKVTVLAASAVALFCLAAPSQAAVKQCKSSPAAGIGLTQDAAIVSWRNWVTNNQGAEWSNFGLAKGASWSETNLGLTTMKQVSAVPCRPFPLLSVKPPVAGTLQVKP